MKKNQMKKILPILTYSLTCFLMSSCAYRFGSPERRVPGGYHLLAVPVFTNKTQETGAETYFTKAMIMGIEKSSLAKVTSKEESQAIVLGEIRDLHYEPGAQISNQTKGEQFQGLPSTFVLTKEYRVKAEAYVKLIRSSDMAVLWEGTFHGEQRYPAPLITKQVLNTANPIYNQSAHEINIQQIAQDMMTDAFERMTENF
jgi:hypothetical protein